MTTTDSFLRDQLLDRRQRLEAVVAGSRDHTDLVNLLGQVDSALQRMDAGTYGICEYCHEDIGKEWLLTNPLTKFCLEHLSPNERGLLEQDLALASQIQREMLPKPHLMLGGWEIAYHYKPLGLVSGDYCDVVTRDGDGESLLFILGDASGKGLAASMLMAHLRAIFRALSATALPLDKLVEQAGRIFRESAMAPYFATLVCGRAGASGEIELCNAGHCPPLALRDGQVTRFEATGMPLGLFSEGTYSSATLRLGAGDSLLLYTDGLSEARNPRDEEYGELRLAALASGRHAVAAPELVGRCVEDVAVFRSGTPLADDMTVMAVHRLN
ncbi:MAG TPA: SpoIIE family protein phosphatase [Terriglobia bacterium]|nr:SpoIIE family protein phosphatase [Terriglobia bacterium]